MCIMVISIGNGLNFKHNSLFVYSFSALCAHINNLKANNTQRSKGKQLCKLNSRALVRTFYVFV